MTRCARAGVDMILAMRLSDHRSIATVRDCYRAIDAGDGAAALEKIFGHADNNSRVSMETDGAHCTDMR